MYATTLIKDKGQVPSENLQLVSHPAVEMRASRLLNSFAMRLHTNRKASGQITNLLSPKYAQTKYIYRVSELTILLDKEQKGKEDLKKKQNGFMHSDTLCCQATYNISQQSIKKTLHLLLICLKAQILEQDWLESKHRLTSNHV